VQQELIAEIHRTAVWPVVVTVDGNISMPGKTAIIDRDASYIMLIPDANIHIFKAEINGLAQDGTKFTQLWSSETRFVVAGTNHFSVSEQTQIFEFLSGFRIYNCVIVSREHYTIGREYSRPMKGNEVDTDTKFGLYTWFPYQSPDRCTNVSDITLLSNWVISAQGHFTNNTDLFPRKISNSFNGCPMKAVLRQAHSSFTTEHFYNQDDPKKVMHLGGLEVDLLMIVLKQMNMTFEHVPTPEGFDIEYGLTNNFSSAMIANGVYIALGAVGTYILENSFFESTNAHMVMSASWHVPCPDKYPRWSSFFRILSVKLWLILTISIVVVAISTTLLARYSCMSERQVYKSLTSSLTNIWSVILGVAVSMMPRAPSLRLLFLAWVCFSLAFSTVFQAFLTTFLTNSGYKKPFQNINEVSAAGISFFYKPEYNFLFDGNETGLANVQIYSPQDLYFEYILEIMKWASNNKNISLFFDDLWVESYYDTCVYGDQTCEPAMCKLEYGFVYNNRLSMVMFHGDPLLRRVSEIIDRVVEAGLYRYWISLETNAFTLISGKRFLFHPSEEFYSFNIYHMEPAFYLLLMGWCLSSLCFMVELLYDRLLRKR
jgi:hypothetical protein